MVKDVLTYPKDKEVLTSISEPIKEEEIGTEELNDLIEDLKDTLKAHDSGVGISAVQIGVLKRLCVIRYNAKFYILINPIITKRRGEVDFLEGCLSAPGVQKTCKRSQKVWCDYIDENGKKQTADQGGLFSIIVQHELDHLDGWCEVFDEVREDNEE